MKLRTIVLILSLMLVIHISYKFLTKPQVTLPTNHQNTAGDSSKLNYDLYWAAYEGDQEKVKALIAQGADVNAPSQSSDHATPLHMAVTYGDVNKLHLKDQSTLPDEVYTQSRLKLVKLLIESGANIRASTIDGATPLHMATTKEIVALLIEHGAIVDAQDFSNERLTPLLMATVRHKSVVEALINHGANVNQKTTSGDAPLLNAVRAKNIEVVELLINSGADINYKNPSGMTALEFAFQNQSREIQALLVGKGAIVTGESELGLDELNFAVKNNDLAMVSKLLAMGKGVDPVSKEGRTPLMEAVFNNNKAMAELLINHGANVNFSSERNWNNKPILFFINDKEMMALFLSHGVNTKAIDDNGHDVLYYLQGKDDLTEMVKMGS